MKTLWVMFWIGSGISIAVLSPPGQALLVVLMITLILAPLVFLLVFVPAVTAALGIFLLSHSLLARLTALRRVGRVAVFFAAIGLALAGLTSVPLLLNARNKADMRTAVADDMPLGVARAPGQVVAINYNGKHPADCGRICAEYLASAPGGRVVLARFDPEGKTLDAAPPSEATAWALGPARIGHCPWPLNQASNRLLIALA